MMRFLLSFLLVITVVKSNHVISPAEVYWRAVLPNTSMPLAIRQLIDADPKSKHVVKMDWCGGITLIFNVAHAPLDTPPANILSTLFLKKNLYPGAKLKDVNLVKRSIIGNVFVPRPEADAIPFSSNNLPKILEHFSMAPNSEDAKLMEETITKCENPPTKGEKKLCSTSLESMVDNVISLLGTSNIQVMSTTINGHQHEKMAYKISSPIKKFSEQDELVICHPLPSPQAVHYCHKSTAYKVYIIPLIGNNGSMINAITVCHYDLMNIDSFILEVLKVKSGVEPICHFLPEDQFLWVSRTK
ncbi:BURP domain-containing protein 6-like [Carex rostrata]